MINLLYSKQSYNTAPTKKVNNKHNVHFGAIVRMSKPLVKEMMLDLQHMITNKESFKANLKPSTFKTKMIEFIDNPPEDIGQAIDDYIDCIARKKKQQGVFSICVHPTQGPAYAQISSPGKPKQETTYFKLYEDIANVHKANLANKEPENLHILNLL